MKPENFVILLFIIISFAFFIGALMMKSCAPENCRQRLDSLEFLHKIENEENVKLSRKVDSLMQQKFDTIYFDSVIYKIISDKKTLIQIIDSINRERNLIQNTILANLISRQMATEKTLKDNQKVNKIALDSIALMSKLYYIDLVLKTLHIYYNTDSLVKRPANIDTLITYIDVITRNWIILTDSTNVMNADSLMKILKPQIIK